MFIDYPSIFAIETIYKRFLDRYYNWRDGSLISIQFFQTIVTINVYE